MDWQTAELLGYAFYSKQGYRILVSLIQTSSYDFVIEKNGVFKRINVKVAGQRDKRNHPKDWGISIASPTAKRQFEVDVYLAWLPHQDRFVELPGDFFAPVKSCTRQIPRYLLDEGQRV